MLGAPGTGKTAFVEALAEALLVPLVVMRYEAIIGSFLGETGEVKRVVSSLLMLVDELPAHVVVVAASNHPELLDPGRRFELMLKLPEPTPDTRLRWWTRYLENLPMRVKASSKTLAGRTPAKNFAELDDLGQDIRWQLVLNVDADPSRVVNDRIARWRELRDQRA